MNYCLQEGNQINGFIILLLTMLAGVFTGCVQISTSDAKLPRDTRPKTGEFFAYNNLEPYGRGSTKNFYNVDASLMYTGTECEIWVEKSANVSMATAKSIADIFDTKIYNDNLYYFGDFRPGLRVLFDDDFVDQKVIFLLLDIKDSYSQSRSMTYTAGYFSSNDILPSTSSFEKYSNSRAMLYIDVNPGNPDSQSARATVAHEFQHLINFCQSLRYRIRKTSSNNLTLYTMDGWIDEGLASAAEHIYYDGNVASKINHYNADPFGTIAKGNNFFVWGKKDDISESILDDYATVYLFFQWLRIQVVNGHGIYKDVISSNEWDYKAVTKAASARGFSTALNNTGQWDYLLKKWLIANCRNDPTGIHGYKGEIETRVHDAPSGSMRLDPGEAVYAISADLSDTSYINTDTIVGKDKQVIYNANTENRQFAQEFVTLTSSISFADEENRVRQAARSAVSAPIAVDVWDLVEGGREPQQISISGVMVE